MLECVADTVTAHQRDRIGIPTSVVWHEGGRTLDLCEAIILYYTRGVKGKEVLTRTRGQGEKRCRQRACEDCVVGLMDHPGGWRWVVDGCGGEHIFLGGQ